MREEATFRCRWKRTAKGYTLWVPGYPGIRLEAASLSAGSNSVSELLLERGVAATAVIELSPRAPIAEALQKFTQPELYLIIGDDPCYSGSVDSKALLTGSNCARCHCVSGVRNERQLELDCSVRGDGGFTYDGGYTYRFFSGEFLEQLSTEERQRLQFRPIRKRGRRPFFELVGPHGVPTVAVAGLQPSGWFCPDCERRTIAYFIDEMPIGTFVSRTTLPNPLPTLFTVSDGHSLELCATAARWDELREMPKSRGVISHLLGVVKPGDVTIPSLVEYGTARTRT